MAGAASEVLNGVGDERRFSSAAPLDCNWEDDEDTLGASWEEEAWDDSGA